jgi:hypothetical protein
LLAESLAVLKQEAKDQERLVRSLKKKGLWSKKLDHILEVLVELIHALHEQLIDAFYPEGEGQLFFISLVRWPFIREVLVELIHTLYEQL